MWKISFTWTRGVLSVMEHLAHVDRLVAIRLEQLDEKDGSYIVLLMSLKFYWKNLQKEYKKFHFQ